MAHDRSPVIVAMADGRVVDAMEGMDGLGQLIVRTARDGARVLEPFYPHQAGRQGHRPRARICWRIVVRRHHGDLGFTSAPGDTRLQVLVALIQNG